MHYVLDLWFEKVIRKQCKGNAYIVRYCDDFVCCFEYEHEAKAFYEALIRRLNKFNLQIAEDKTKIIYFGRKRMMSTNKKVRKSHQHLTFWGLHTIVAAHKSRKHSV